MAISYHQLLAQGIALQRMQDMVVPVRRHLDSLLSEMAIVEEQAISTRCAATQD